MGFKVFDPSSEYLELPFPDKTYRVPSPPHEVGILMQRMTAAQLKAARGAALSDDEKEMLATSAEDVGNVQYEKLLLGEELYAELKADRVNSFRWNLVVNTAALWAATNSLEDVEEFWNSGGKRPKAQDPESVAPEPEVRMVKAPTDRQPKKTSTR